MGHAGRIPTHGRTESAQRGPDAQIARIAAVQHGRITLDQLRACGLTASAVRNRVAAGRLHRVHQGVYAVGHPLASAPGHWIGAVLACGPGGVLSHRSAAALHGLRPTSRPNIDVIAPGRTGRARPGIEVHRADTLSAADVTVVQNIACTTVARTLLDIAPLIDDEGLAEAVDRAEQLRTFDRAALDDVLARAGRSRNGAARLRVVLGEERPFTRSTLERRFLALCRRFGIPQPEVNVWMEIGGKRIQADFVWADRRLIVETDGGTHATRRARESDYRRDALVRRARWNLQRFTWSQVTGEPSEVAATVLMLLAIGG